MHDADYCYRCSQCLSFCLSHGSTWLHCAKTAEQIKVLFGMNTPGGLRLGSLSHRREEDGDIILNFGTPFISLEWLKLQTVCHHHHHQVSLIIQVDKHNCDNK